MSNITSPAPQLQIGSKVWVHRRSYFRYDRNKTSRDGYEELTVTGENRVNWLLEHYRNTVRINKKTLACNVQVFFDEPSLSKHCAETDWLNEHQYRIGQEVQRCYDYEKMKAIAAIVGYNA